MWWQTVWQKVEKYAQKRKRDSKASAPRRQEKEEEVDTVYEDLKEKHGNKFDTPRLWLWSRMICSNLHEDMENPPFSGSVPKKPWKGSVTDVWQVQHLHLQKHSQVFQKTNQTSGSVSVSHPPVTSGVSPNKAIELRHLQFQPSYILPSPSSMIPLEHIVYPSWQ